VLILLQDIFIDLESGQEAECSPVAAAGRVMNKRVMGKLAFLTLRDDRGQIQVSVRVCVCTKAPIVLDGICWLTCYSN
jgi:lysyl-tRNA synthetase class II